VDTERARTAEHHYEGEGVFGFIEDRIEHELHDEPVFQRDPEYLEQVLPQIRKALSYFDPEVRGMEHLPESGPFVIAANHSGGIYMPDAFILATEWYRERGVDQPIYGLMYDFAFQIPRLGPAFRRLGCIPASHANAQAAIERGAPVVVYPGGDHDAFRPWVDRHHIDLHGHKGFVRMALRHGVPVVPMVSHGSHETVIVLWRGARLAKLMGLNRLRVKIFPILFGPPWGVAPVFLPTFPLPARVTVQVCEPFDWSHLPPEAAEDEDAVEHCYEEVLGRMQANFDELVEEQPRPLLDRLGPR
jgi:1-acyl-sn-glycerol-3-phosphate acyltransferase